MDHLGKKRGETLQSLPRRASDSVEIGTTRFVRPGDWGPVGRNLPACRRFAGRVFRD